MPSKKQTKKKILEDSIEGSGKIQTTKKDSKSSRQKETKSNKEKSHEEDDSLEEVSISSKYVKKSKSTKNSQTTKNSTKIETEEKSSSSAEEDSVDEGSDHEGSGQETKRTKSTKKGKSTRSTKNSSSKSSSSEDSGNENESGESSERSAEKKGNGKPKKRICFKSQNTVFPFNQDMAIVPDPVDALTDLFSHVVLAQQIHPPGKQIPTPNDLPELPTNLFQLKGTQEEVFDTEKMSISELKRELQERGLPVTGTKQDLKLRLEADILAKAEEERKNKSKKKSKKAAKKEEVKEKENWLNRVGFDEDVTPLSKRDRKSVV